MADTSEIPLDDLRATARRIVRKNLPLNELHKHDMNTLDMVCDVWVTERQKVEKYGHCSGNCTSDNLFVHEVTGNVCCKWTYRPCPRNEHAELIELFSLVNAKGNVLCQQPQ